MDGKWTCPRQGERLTPPRNDELTDAVCWTCPYLMREVDERGQIALYCLVYRNRFRSSNPTRSALAGEPVATVRRGTRLRA